MSILFWVGGFIVLCLLPYGVTGTINIRPVYIGGWFQTVAPFIPSILGAIGSLFKGKKTQYANQMTPEQQAVYSQMLKMLQRQAGSGSAGYKPTSDALAMLYKTFLPGMSYTPSTGGYNYGQTATSVTPRTLRQPGATGRAGR